MLDLPAKGAHTLVVAARNFQRQLSGEKLNLSSGMASAVSVTCCFLNHADLAIDD